MNSCNWDPNCVLLDQNKIKPVKFSKSKFLSDIWDFSRPHTIIGSSISIISLFMYAIPFPCWKNPMYLRALLGALIPSLLMNLYITGLNQLTDVEIDKINKPYLPLASGALSFNQGVLIVVFSLLISLKFAYHAYWPLKVTLLGSWFLGTIYSLPPFRLKRFPLLAAFCILIVRGSLVNLGFIMQVKYAHCFSYYHGIEPYY